MRHKVLSAKTKVTKIDEFMKPIFDDFLGLVPKGRVDEILKKAGDTKLPIEEVDESRVAGPAGGGGAPVGELAEPLPEGVDVRQVARDEVRKRAGFDGRGRGGLRQHHGERGGAGGLQKVFAGDDHG